MDQNTVSLKEQRAALIAASRQLVEKAESEKRDFTGEETEQWVRLNTDIDKAEADIRQAERKAVLAERENSLRAIEPRKSAPAAPQRTISRYDRNQALKTWMGYNSGARMVFDGAAFQRCADMGFNLSQPAIETRSMNTSSSGAGGAGTFTTTFPELQTEMKYFSNVIDRCTVHPTSDGNTFTLPRGTDVANTMAIVAQTSGSGTSTDPTFDKVQLGAYYFRYIELVTYEMLEDAVFDVEAWLTTRLAERAARTLEKYIISGTGSSQPTGIVQAGLTANSGASVTLASGHSSFYRFEDLFSTFKSVDLAYRPQCTLVTADSSIWDLRGIKDSQGRYLWDVNNTLVQNSQPDKIAGFNYLVSNSIDASGSFSANIAVFADLSRMAVRLVDSVKIVRLNELYRANGMIGFEVSMRFDCNYVGHPASIAVVATPSS